MDILTLRITCILSTPSECHSGIGLPNGEASKSKTTFEKNNIVRSRAHLSARRFASQDTSSIIGVGHGRIANIGHPRSSQHHQTNDSEERSLCAIHYPESGQGTSFDGKCHCNVCPTLPSCFTLLICFFLFKKIK